MTNEQTLNAAAQKTGQERKSKSAGGEAAKPESGAKPEPAAKPERRPFTLAIDIGGTGIKAEKLDGAGKPITERTKIATPKNATPKKVAKIIDELAAQHGSFDRVSVGFPGVVKNGAVYTAANLGKGWEEYPLQKELQKRLKKPVRMANDADVQGLGCISGRGVELVITLGTGMGSVIFVDGRRIHMEIGHHPFHKGKTYEEELGNRALAKKGKKKWAKVVLEAIGELDRTFNYDQLYIGGGNARLLDGKLPANVKIVSNMEGLLGGIKLWASPDK
jgi:polyphosphate glucokinase